MQKPLIGITAGEIHNRDYPWSPVVHGQGHTYIDAIVRAGGLPVVLPITSDKTVIEQLCNHLDGLVMSGGNDITPSVYGEEAYEETHDTSDARDYTEKLLLENFIDTNKPILAICRGMQFLNVYCGGTLYQHIKKDLPHTMNHELSTESGEFNHIAHGIEIRKDSKLAGILENVSIRTNTHHHQAIKKLGKGLSISARSEDDIIEAIESDDDRFIIGIQAHPESLGSVIPTWNKLFAAFVDAAVGPKAEAFHFKNQLAGSTE